ncbi:MAG: MFS transporter, partial [Deltaproteobacteria bacterium]|nr:MFS transporter [Deltaproteobacteria bacterium]
SLYLQYIQGLDAQQAGLVLVSQPVVQALFSPLAGRLSDRVQPRLVATAGMGLTVIGLLLLSRFGPSTAIPYIVASLIVLGLGFAFFASPNTNAVMASVERAQLGVASGILATMRLTGQMLSMALAMLVLALTLGKEAITPERYPLFLSSTHTFFFLLAGICFAGIFASLARGKTRRRT